MWRVDSRTDERVPTVGVAGTGSTEAALSTFSFLQGEMVVFVQVDQGNLRGMRALRL